MPIKSQLFRYRFKGTTENINIITQNRLRGINNCKTFPTDDFTIILYRENARRVYEVPA